VQSNEKLNDKISENPWTKKDTDNEDIPKNQRNVKIDVDKLESEKNYNDKEKFNLISNATEEQKEYIKRAFANDDVEASFQDEKKKLISDMIPEDIMDDGKLPGWGSWTGEGIVHKVNHKKEKEKEEKKTQLENKLMSERKDAHLKHVIINHKRDKKTTKYKTSDLPYPYTSKDVYERSLKHPLGREWNTYTTHAALIKPRINKTKGAVINPIDRKAKKKHNKSEPKK